MKRNSKLPHVVPSWGAKPGRMPVATVGTCIRWRQCKQFKTDLADGLCQAHWDKCVTR